MHERDRHAAPLEAPRRLEPEQSAADHHGAALGLRRFDHGLDVGNVAEAAHIGQAEAWNRRHHRLRAGREQQFVVRHGTAVIEHDLPRRAVDRHGSSAKHQPNAAFGVPARPVDDDLIERLISGQHRRQQDAVVVRVRLGADDRDLVTVGCARQALFQCAHSRHAVADDNEPWASPAVALHGAITRPRGRG